MEVGIPAHGPQRVLRPQQREKGNSNPFVGLQGFYHIRYKNYLM